MGEKKEMSLRMFEGNLSPVAQICFKLLLGNVRKKMKSSGPQGNYELGLAEVLKESGTTDVEQIAKSIREIIQCKVEIREGEFQYFFPFLSSIRIEAGMIKYGIPREVEENVADIPAM